MLIRVDRVISRPSGTLSRIWLGDDIQCIGLEDVFREEKVPGQTRIPAGIYDITLRKHGGFHERYSRANWISDIHEGMLWVRDVPQFEYILIHVGNDADDTDGCLLVGKDFQTDPLVIWNSRKAYRELYQKVLPYARENRLRIQYQDNDR